jgi:hypothetical protein
MPGSVEAGKKVVIDAWDAQEKVAESSVARIF